MLRFAKFTDVFKDGFYFFLQTSTPHRIVQTQAERLYASFRSVLQRAVRAELTGDATAEAALLGREEQEGTQDEG